MRKIVIIEDKFSHFEELKKGFEKNLWEVLPKSYDDISSFYNTEKVKELEIFIENLISDNEKDIGGVVLDINLFGLEKPEPDKAGLENLLGVIRNIHLEEHPFWGKRLPIIAHSRFTDKKTKEQAFAKKYFVHAFINKDINNGSVYEVVLTAEALYSIFMIDINNDSIYKNTNQMFNQISIGLSELNQALVSRIDELTVSIKGDILANRESYNLLFNLLISKNSPDEIEKFFSKYNLELSNLLGGSDNVQSYLDALNNSKSNFKQQLVDCVKTGAAADFVQLFQDIIKYLHDEGIIDIIPLGNFLGIALTTLLKLYKAKL